MHIAAWNMANTPCNKVCYWYPKRPKATLLNSLNQRSLSIVVMKICK